MLRKLRSRVKLRTRYNGLRLNAAATATPAGYYVSYGHLATHVEADTSRYDCTNGITSAMATASYGAHVLLDRVKECAAGDYAELGTFRVITHGSSTRAWRRVPALRFDACKLSRKPPYVRSSRGGLVVSVGAFSDHVASASRRP